MRALAVSIAAILLSSAASAAPIQLTFKGNLSLQGESDFSFTIDYDSGLAPERGPQGVETTLSRIFEDTRIYRGLGGTLDVMGNEVAFTGARLFVTPGIARTPGRSSTLFNFFFSRGLFNGFDGGGALVEADEELLWTEPLGRPGFGGNVFANVLRSLNLTYFLPRDSDVFPIDSLPTDQGQLEGLLPGARLSYTIAASVEAERQTSLGFNASNDLFDNSFGVSVSCLADECDGPSSGQADADDPVTVPAPATAALLLAGIVGLLNVRRS